MPEGYLLLDYEPSLNRKWVDFLNRNQIDFGIWDESKLNQLIISNSIPGSVFLIGHKGKIIGCASLTNYKRDLPSTTINYVLVDKDHRGKGIGYCLCQFLISFAQESKYSELILRTDGVRKSAISLYLRAGFLPFCSKPHQQKRWIKTLISIIIDE
jgi:GNAT superfamily N-acetyltransferase